MMLFAAVCAALFTAACNSIAPERQPISAAATFAGLNERFGEPFGIAARAGETFVSDGEQGKIWKLGANGAMSVVSDRLDTPSQIVFDANGDLLVADAGTHTIKRVKLTGETETVAGVENQSGYADGAANAALFNAPVGIAAFENKIYVADTYNDRIRLIENGQVSTLAGGAKGFADDAGARARFDTPVNLAVLKNGRILVADTGNKRIRAIDAAGNVATFAGNGGGTLKDGLLSQADFVFPSAIAINDAGAIFIADGNAIRVIRSLGLPFVETVSDEERGYADGAIKTAQFNRPSGLAIGADGNLYIADSENQTIRVFSSGAIGEPITDEKRENLRYKPEEFRRMAPPRWTYDPPNNPRDVAGTLGELRGEVNAPNKSVWFHNGLDIAGNYGETARFIRDGKVLKPLAAENFETLRELVRLPTIGYIHIRLGRDKNGVTYDDRRFQFQRSDAGKLSGVRIPRGSRFRAGEAIGTLNAFNHVHLIAGRTGAEMNALDALEFPGIGDNVAPTIEKVTFFDESWQPIETSKENARINLQGKTRIVVRAFDQMDGNNSRRRLGVYKIGYEILRADRTPLDAMRWTISFARMPDESAARFVYAAGSQSGYTPETIFNYIATNEVSGDAFKENFFDAASSEKGDYVLRVAAADFFGNVATKEINFGVK